MQALFDAVNAICAKIPDCFQLVLGFPLQSRLVRFYPHSGKIFQSGNYFISRYRYLLHLPPALCTGTQLYLRCEGADAAQPYAQRYFLTHSLFAFHRYACRSRQYLGCNRCDFHRRPGRAVLDVGFRLASACNVPLTMKSTLSQICKEKRDNEYVGGLPFYARKLLNDSAAAGVALSMLYIVYALLCFPAQGFNTISAVGAIAGKISGVNIPTNSSLYWISFAVLIVITAVISFGGIKKVTKVTDRIVPVMAVIYVLTVIALTVGNIDRIPLFFSSVFTQAFAPDAVFGGAFGLALSQGIKRGLMSNEAGQGTITMPAAAAEVSHPCEQGCVQALGVFLDTIVICTLTGFVVIMGSMWLTADANAWF